MAGLKSRNQGLLVDDAAARDVDEGCAGLEHGKPPGIKESPGVRSLRQHADQDIIARKDLRQRVCACERPDSIDALWRAGPTLHLISLPRAFQRRGEPQ